jgi:hypothetical protein
LAALGRQTESTSFGDGSTQEWLTETSNRNIDLMTAGVCTQGKRI